MAYTLAPNESPHSVHEQEAFQLNPSLPKENTEISPIDLGRSRSHSDTSHHKGSAIHLPQLPQGEQKISHGRLGRIVRNIWLTAFLPVVAFAYLSFCYVVATHIVQVRIYKVNQPLEHLCKYQQIQERLSLRWSF